jgi:glutaconate CoA-transferase subunit B
MIYTAARLLQDNKTVLVGSGMPLAAGMLAKKTFAPHLIMVFEAGGFDPEFTRLPLSVGESITYHRATYAGGMDDVMGDAGKGIIDFGFLGGAQIDMYGNLNSTVIGDYHQPKARFPGSGGANDLGSLCLKTIAIMRHERRRFLKRVDFITTPGYLDGPGARERAGLPEPGGPWRVVTTLGIMGFDEETKRMELLAVYEGVTKDDVIAATDFELIIKSEPEVLPSPDAETIRIFREEIDPIGVISGKSKGKD